MKPKLSLVNNRRIALKYKRLFPSCGDRLWAWRKTKGWTQAQMAEECGLSASAIGYFERGYTLGMGRTLQRYAKAFGISIDYLLDISDSEEIHDASIPTRKSKHA